MNFLEEKIAKDGIVKEGNVLKVDSFLNHQMDIELFNEMGKEWKTLLRSNKNKHTAFAYVWNKTDDWCSEFGSVAVQNRLGGITRIG